MFEIDRLLPLIAELKNVYRIRIILSPRPLLPSRTSLRKVGERRYTIEYNPDLCETGDLAYELLRAAQLGNLEWATSASAAVAPEDRRAQLVAHKARTIFFDFWIKEEMLKRGFTYGGYIKDYFTGLLEQMEAGVPLYADLGNERDSQACYALDYLLYLFNQHLFPSTFNDRFRSLYTLYCNKAVQIAHAMKEAITGVDLETPAGAFKGIGRIFAILDLGKNITPGFD